MMNYSKRSDGRRLLLVIAVFGILSTYGISTANLQVTVTDAASIEESSEPTIATAGDQATDGDLTATAGGAETASEAEKVTETSVGETATSPGESQPEGTSDEQAGNTVGGSSITGGEGTADTPTSDGKSSTGEGVSVRTGSDDTGVESSAGGTEGGTTATIREAPSATGTTGTEKQITEGETTAPVTGATSTDEAGDKPLEAIQLEETTGAATAEEDTTSVKQTSEAADAQYTTNMGDTSAERHTETPVPVKVTVIAVSSTLAPTECGSKQSCACRNITIKANPAAPPQWTISGSIWKADGLYHAEFLLENLNNVNQREVFKRNRTRKLNCPNEVNRLVTRLKSFKRGNSSAPMPSTSTTPPSTPVPTPSAAYRKRRQADQATTSSLSEESITLFLDIGFEELKDLLRASIDDDDDEDSTDSNENSSPALESSPALQSSPQSTEALAESSTASDTTSIVLTSTSTVSAKAQDPKAVKEPTQTPGQDVWSAHRGIFLTVAILISVCVVVTAFCCLCMKWRERGGSRNPEKHPIAMEEAREAPTAVSNPITDREMIQDEAPMQERENPAVTPNGGGQHISKADEDNGWVVPLDELSNAEKEKPEVENTRL